METDEALQFLADVFWFTIEFGVMREDGEVRAYGAGILSSYGEIEEFRGADLRPLDLLEMGTLEYDITQYQPVLFCADGMGELEDVGRRLLRRLRRRHAGAPAPRRGRSARRVSGLALSAPWRSGASRRRGSSSARRTLHGRRPPRGARAGGRSGSACWWPPWC